MARIIDERQLGDERIFDVLSSNFTRKGAVQEAMIEVHPLIPYRDQDVINVTVDKDLGFRTRFIITISHNSDHANDGY